VSIRIVINLSEDSADVLSIYGAGAKVYLDSAATEGGSYSNVTSTTVVSGTEQYELTDSAGTSATWYKTRVGDSGGTSYSSYSAAFQATAWGAYATADDLLATMDVPSGTGSSNRRAVLSDLLMDAKAQTDTDCARTFLRVPQVSGDITVYCDINHAGHSSLVSAIGIPYTTDGRARRSRSGCRSGHDSRHRVHGASGCHRSHPGPGVADPVARGQRHDRRRHHRGCSVGVVRGRGQGVHRAVHHSAAASRNG
jgi:hypothetical protein